MAFDLRVLRSALVPLALIVCVTVALWELRGTQTVPSHRNVPYVQQSGHSSAAPTPRVTTPPD